MQKVFAAATTIAESIGKSKVSSSKIGNINFVAVRWGISLCSSKMEDIKFEVARWGYQLSAKWGIQL